MRSRITTLATPRCRLVAACLATWPTLGVAQVDAPRAPLASVAEQRDFESVQALLQQGADLDASQVDGMTALHWAVFHDHEPTARLLTEAGAHAAPKNRYGVTPLSLACTNGNAAIVQLLVEAGADPNTTLRGGETALMTAARTGRVGPVQALLAAGAKIDDRERNDQTALMWAAADGHAEVVDLLIQAGADFRAPLDSGFNPLFFAVREGETAVVERLIDLGADVNGAMQPRSSSGNAPAAGTSPLLLAVENGHFRLAAVLLERGANPNDQRTGYTALHAITWIRKPRGGDGDPSPIGSGDLTSLQLVRRLVQHGADLNVKHAKRSAGRAQFNMTDATPFLLASRTGDVPLMQLLLELGADPTIHNALNCTPLLAAAGVGALGSGDLPAATEAEAIEAVKLLLEIGAEVNAVDVNGETAMHGAAYKNRPLLVHFLAEQGADAQVWNRKNKHGWTPLLIAQGYRPGNFRPAPATIEAVEQVMRAAGVEPPQDDRRASPRGGNRPTAGSE